MEIKVKLEQIRPVETFGENGFKVQRIWVISDYDTSHPQILQFDLSPKLIGKLDKLTSGIVMTLYFNIIGNIVKEKRFVSLKVWKYIVDGSKKSFI